MSEVELKPFFSYYGGKWRVGLKYPEPVYGEIVEPFAGSAGYSMRYYDRDVLLCDLNPVVSGLWEYLIKVKEEEVMGLPLEIDHVDNLVVCEEARWLIGFWLNKGGVSPKKSPSKWMRSGMNVSSHWGEAIRFRIASQLKYIRHWRVVKGSYEDLENREAVWFVDPPYVGRAGQEYRYKFSEYDKLGEWCRGRLGQVIVCEQSGADWLPFEPFMSIKALEGRHGRGRSEEVVWVRG
jgi:hypothetical protein